MFSENTIMIKYSLIVSILLISLVYTSQRKKNLMYGNRRTICYFIRKIYHVPKKCGPNCNGRPGGVHGVHNDPILSGLLPQNNSLPSNNSDNYFNSLAGLAPIALTMYCFNSSPKLTMITLTTLLLFIIGSDSD